MTSTVAKTSADCRNGGHRFCQGTRFIGYESDGRTAYGRCQCDCHKSSVPPDRKGSQ